MSISDIRAFLAERSNLADLGRQQNLRTENQDNRQAAGTQGSRVSLSTSLSISSQSFIGARILTNGFNQSLNLSEQRPNFSLPEPDDNQRIGFDFEEVARNVLGFVGSVIRGAQARGEDEEELLDLFQQARRGVESGIGQAIEDLEGFIDDDIQEGIDNSRNLIEEGISGLERDIFSPLPPSENQQEIENETRLEQRVSVSDQRSGDLRIRTRDGDEVRIRFEDIQQFQQSQSLLIQTRNEQSNQTEIEQTTRQTTEEEESSEAAQTSNDAGVPNSSEIEGNDTPLINVQNPPQTVFSEQTAEGSQGQEPEDDESETAATTSVANGANTIPTDRDATIEQSVEFEQSSVFFERNSFSFSVEGELDDDELRAIGELVSDTASLATEFFDGDIDAAFEQALQLGFDETELTGFALQLDSVQQTRVTQTYESVSQFNNNEEGEQERVSSVRPVADYLSDLLSVFEQSRQLLQSGEVFNDLINDVFNRVLQIDTPDLVNALNRFNSFNERLLGNVDDVSESNTENTAV
jgi:hypothetical protein